MRCKRLLLSGLGGVLLWGCGMAPKPIPMPTLAPTLSARPTVRGFLADCEGLARTGMPYRFGGDDPSEGGFDCSGTIHYLLKKQGFRGLPRQANHLYQWLDQARTLTKVRGKVDPETVYRRLEPGDLLFWKGTYKTRRNPNVTHVMVYLGYDREKGEHVMFGARGTKSTGRNGNGVDLHRFSLGAGKGTFVGYGRIPELVPFQG